MCERNETMAKRTAPTAGREEYRRMPQRRRAAGRTEESAALADDRNMLPVYLTIGILAVVGVVVAIDALSVPALAALAIIAIGGVIAAVAMYG
jgi:hypothetical protein